MAHRLWKTIATGLGNGNIFLIYRVNLKTPESTKIEYVKLKTKLGIVSQQTNTTFVAVFRCKK